MILLGPAEEHRECLSDCLPEDGESRTFTQPAVPCAKLAKGCPWGHQIPALTDCTGLSYEALGRMQRDSNPERLCSRHEVGHHQFKVSLSLPELSSAAIGEIRGGLRV